MLKDFLNTGNCFKLICGAANSDSEEIEKLIAVYSAAGCRFFDVAADINAVKAAKKGIENSGKKDCYICISIGTKDDIHLSKMQINQQKCTQCGRCADICERKAITEKNNEYSINTIRCIGCQKCKTVCEQKAINAVYDNKDINNILTEGILSAIDCIEFHVSSSDEKEILTTWELLNKKFDGFLSISINRQKLSDSEIMSILTKMLKTRKPYSAIIQADGNPMTGGKDDFQTTMQAVATAEFIHKLNLPVYMFIAGGTNTKTKELAKLCNLNICGIAAGSFARKKIKDFLTDDILTSSENFQKAVQKAEEIISSII